MVWVVGVWGGLVKVAGGTSKTFDHLKILSSTIS